MHCSRSRRSNLCSEDLQSGSSWTSDVGHWCDWEWNPWSASILVETEIVWVKDTDPDIRPTLLLPKTRPMVIRHHFSHHESTHLCCAFHPGALQSPPWFQRVGRWPGNLPHRSRSLSWESGRKDWSKLTWCSGTGSDPADPEFLPDQRHHSDEHWILQYLVQMTSPKTKKRETCINTDADNSRVNLYSVWVTWCYKSY